MINYLNLKCQRGTSDSVANFSAFSNPADAQNVSCLGLCGRDICTFIRFIYLQHDTL